MCPVFPCKKVLLLGLLLQVMHVGSVAAGGLSFCKGIFSLRL